MTAYWRLRLTSVLMVLVAVCSVGCTKSKGPGAPGGGPGHLSADPTCSLVQCAACPTLNNDWAVCYNEGLSGPGGLWECVGTQVDCAVGGGPYVGSDGQTYGSSVNWAVSSSYGGCNVNSSNAYYGTPYCVTGGGPTGTNTTRTPTVPCAIATTNCSSSPACPAASNGDPQTSCNGVCTDTTTDNNNCSSCGNVCVGGEVCGAGGCVTPVSCTTASPHSYKICSQSQVDLCSSQFDCGACGVKCIGGQLCAAGGCACPAGESLCSGQCVNTNTDAANCGTCGVICSNGTGCNQGACQCSAGLTLCSTSTELCSNLATSVVNCGVCNNPCGAGQTCQEKTPGVSAGGYQCACPSTSPTLCANGCTNTLTDPNNCSTTGVCGTVCQAPTSVCSSGSCVAPSYNICSSCGSAASATPCSSGQVCVSAGGGSYGCTSRAGGYSPCSVPNGNQTSCICN